MKKGITTLEFLIGLVMGGLILVALFYPIKAISSLFFGRSQPCIDDAAKSSIDNFANEIELINDGDAAITFGKGTCVFAVFGTITPGISPPEEIFPKKAVCICELNEDQNSCTKNKYCKELNVDSLSLVGFDKNYIGGQDYSILTVYYIKNGNNLIISDKATENELVDEDASEFILTTNLRAVPHASLAEGVIDYPLENPLISSCYGLRKLSGISNWHDGIDFSVSEGTPVKAIADGEIKSACYEWIGECACSVVGDDTCYQKCNKKCENYGNTIVIKHNENLYSRYSHLSSITKSFGSIKRGDIVGYSGNTGYSGGPHIDLKIYLSESQISLTDPDAPNYNRDPLNYLPILSQYNFKESAISCITSPTVIQLAGLGSSIERIAIA